MATITPKQSCATCVYFHEEGPNPQAVGVKMQTCRAYPPQLVAASPGNLISMFPFTKPEGWCGEWTAKAERGGNA